MIREEDASSRSIAAGGGGDSSADADSSGGCVTVRTARLMTDFGYSDAELYEDSDCPSDIEFDAGEWTTDSEEPEDDDLRGKSCNDESTCWAPPFAPDEYADSWAELEDEESVPSECGDSAPHTCRCVDGFWSRADGRLRSLKSLFGAISAQNSQ